MRDWKAYYQKNKEAYAERGRQYRKKNKDKIAKRQAEYRAKNKEKIKEYSKKRYADSNGALNEKQKNSKNYKSKLKGTGKVNLGAKTKELWEDSEYRKMMSDAHKGNKGYWRGKKIPNEAKDKMRESKLRKPTKYWLNKKCPHSAGKNNPGYIHGNSPENKKQRNSMEYSKWRRDVFERDDFTCQECGQRGVKLHADHIKPFSLFPELRFELNNGRTLCVPCHKKTPTYLKNLSMTEYLEIA